MFPLEVRHFSNLHLVPEVFICCLRLSGLNFLISFQDTDVSFSPCPLLPLSDTILLCKSLIQRSLKCFHWHPEALARAGWVWGTKFFITLYSLFSVWYLGKAQMFFHLYFPMQSILIFFYELAISSLSHHTIWKYLERCYSSDLYCSLVNQQPSLLWL